MKTFGLKKPDTPPLAQVQQQIQTMGEQTYGVVQAAQQHLRDTIDGMGAGTYSVVQRAKNGVLGHIRQMNGQLKPIVGSIAGPLNHQLDAMGGIVGHIQTQADILAPPARVEGPTGGLPSILSETYTVLANIECTELAAVPGDMGGWYLAGWEPPAGWQVQGTISGTPESVRKQLESWARPCLTPEHMIQ